MGIATKKRESSWRYAVPPKFTSERFEEGRLNGQGCWPYALNAKYPHFALVGDFIGKRRKYDATNEELIATIIEEGKCFNLEIKLVDENYETEMGEYLIYLRREISGHYHFLRRDADRTWSHKHPYEMPEKVNFEKDHYVSKDNPFSVGFFFSVKEKNR